MAEPNFFMIWNEKTCETRFRHETSESAVAEAQRLARSCPGVRFYVMEAKGFARTVPEPPIYQTLDEIPF